MSEPRAINPMLKQLLELGPVVGFLAVYMLYKDEVFTVLGRDYEAFVAVTAMFVPVFLICSLLLWKLTGKLSRVQLFTIIVLVIMGTLAVAFNDERFIKLKPTITYLVFGAILGFGLLRGVSYLRYLMEEMLPLQDEGWMILTRRLTLFFFAMAVLNEVIWRGFSDDVFVLWDTVGQFVATFGFFMTQAGLFQRFAIEEDSA